MRYNITEYDKNLILQNVIKCKARLNITDDKKRILDCMEGILQIGSYNVDVDSNVRRTINATLKMDDLSDSIETKINHWLGLNFELLIGIYDFRKDDFWYYPCGYFIITSASTHYNAASNSLDLNLSDWFCKLDGTRNGQVGGAPTLLIPAIDGNGNPNTIKESTISLLKGETDVIDYIIEDIGEYKGIANHNPDYLEYRTYNPEWNRLPYDLEFEVGAYVGDMLAEIRDLYPNCQMYFDVYNNFCFNMLPSNESDPILLSNAYMQSILLAESTEEVSYNIEDIKNVTEVYGHIYDIDFMSDDCILNRDTYQLSIADYEKYSSGNIIAFTVNANNPDNLYLSINSLDKIPVFYEFTSNFIAENTLLSGNTYVGRIKRVKGNYVFYYYGQYQPHAICALTSDEKDPVCSKQFFAERYNCDLKNVTLRVDPTSPFTIQKLDIILDVKTGNEYDNIMSDSVAMENAKYQNKKSTSYFDTVTLTTKLIPFLDVGIKVQYQKQQDKEPRVYLIKSLSHNFSGGTTTITMHRFDALYY